MTSIDLHYSGRTWIGPPIADGYAPCRTRRTGGLALWQERRVRDYIDDNLSARLSVITLAGQCRLSVSHFCTAFKVSTGCSPHQFLLQRRVERAKRLLLTTGRPLVDIAMTVGFADQSHFTRVFARQTDATPGAWARRARAERNMP